MSIWSIILDPGRLREVRSCAYLDATEAGQYSLGSTLMS
jgi:hypothetical protein